MQGKHLIYKYHQTYLKQLKQFELKKKNIIITNTNFNIINTRMNILNSFYTNNILEFDDDEKKKIIFTIHLTLRNSSMPYNILHNYFKNWNILKVSNLFENKLPHTINNVIILPNDFILLLKNIINNNNNDFLIKQIGSTLLHEQIHVWQRLHPQLFEKLYIHFWNFKKGPTQIINNILEKENGLFQRKNPDGIDENWLFKYSNNYYLLIAVKLNKNSIDLGHIDKYGILLSAKNYKIITKKDLNKFTYFYYFFGNDDNNYHPNEISATIISEYLFLPHFFKNKSITQSQSFKNIKKWIFYL
jgi:hypothetical protein